MKESLLHYVWQSGAFDHSKLISTCGKEIQIHRRGDYNTDAGPDFQNAVLSIDGLRWAGSVEIHIRSSDWFAHGHQHDAAYNNTILHVVYEHNSEAPQIHGTELSTLELRGRFDPGRLEKQSSLFQPGEIPCSELLLRHPERINKSFLRQVALERLSQKHSRIAGLLLENCNDWEQVFLILLSSHFGLLTNRLPFELLARSVPAKILFRNSSSAFDLESILMGQAGLLQGSFREDYPRSLKKQYEFFRHKYSLQAVDAASWKFMRMRPSNFPGPRISQLASLIQKYGQLAEAALQIQSAEAALAFFDVEASEYWQTHYRFDHKSRKHSCRLGTEAVQLLIINVLLPFLFAYGYERNNPEMKSRAISILENIPSESNRIIRQFAELGLGSSNALESQSLIHLKKYYCDRSRCLKCGIGVDLFGLV